MTYATPACFVLYVHISLRHIPRSTGVGLPKEVDELPKVEGSADDLVRSLTCGFMGSFPLFPGT